MPEQPIIVFDVNETLLDLEAIRPTFDRIFGDPAAMRLWFAGLITYSEALTLAGVYVPFTDIGGAVLRMLAATRGITISGADADELTNRFATMPPHPEVPAALRRLRDHGFRLFTLTDNTLEISGRQLEHGGVIDLFERRFSVDETVKRHKPAQEAYQSVAAALGTDPGGICLIACHVWDTIGAAAAGWQTALILREGNAPLDVGPQPDYIGKDLDAIAGQLIDRYAAELRRPGYAGRVGPEKLAEIARLRRARDLMDREYASPLDVASLARAALMSPAHFSRQFRATYGETPYAYLMTRRIERAKALLRRGDLSVTEVCMAVGCTSLGSFSARFTQLTGETPTAYRARDHGTLAGVPGCVAKDITRPSHGPSTIRAARDTLVG